MKKSLFFLLSSVFVLLSAGPDKALANKLSQLRLQFHNRKNGDFEMLLRSPGDAPLLIVVTAAPLFYMNTYWRQIFVTIPAPTVPDLERKLLMANARLKLAAWEMSLNGKNISLVCRIPENASKEQLQACITFIVRQVSLFRKENASAADKK